ncbi:MAG: HK97 family phage prohead protease [Bacteroidales bacterium]|nr:HK97 family phage prohead protease [Bacteroidales bacterium]
MRIVLCDSGTVNSYGFRTALEGIDLSRFRKNPVMLYNHDPERVIGRWEDLNIEDGQLTATPVFDLEDTFAAEIARKAFAGFIKGCSMGIMIKAMATDENGVNVATKSVLLEASIVSIPADENALVVYEDEDRKKQLSINEFNTLYYKMETKEKTQGVPDGTEVQAESTEVVTLRAQVADKDAQIAELTQQVDNLRKDLAEREYHEAEAFVDQAIADGKITEEVKGEVISFYLSFPKETEKVFGVIKGKADEPEAQQVSLSQMVQNGRGATNKTWDELDKQDGALKALKENSPEEFKRLYKEKFGVEWTF